MDISFNMNISKKIRTLIIFIIILVFVYTILADSIFFIYLIWNIFLAFIPFFISAFLLWYQKKNKKNLVFIFIGLFLWLIFFPNAPYIVTDLIHLGVNPSVPLFLDIILLFSSALVGMYFAVKSLSHIEQIFLSYFSNKKTSIILLFIILLSSFGVYLGRYLRWNSWDTFLQPKYILNDVANIFFNIENHIEAFVITLVFFIFVTFSYYIYKYFKNKML